MCNHVSVQVLLLLSLFAVVACHPRHLAPALKLPVRLVLRPDLELRKLTDKVWIHRSTMVVKPWGRVPSNGLLVVTADGAVLLDTPWTISQTKRLLRWAADSLEKPVRLAIVTHAHHDRMGGIQALLDHRIPVHSLWDTAKRAVATGLPRPTLLFRRRHVVTHGGLRFELFFPGGGHTRDSIVVWLPHARVLYAACMVRSMRARRLGNIKEADLRAWPVSLRLLLKRYSSAAHVIPGHGTPGGLELVRHTLELLVARSK